MWAGLYSKMICLLIALVRVALLLESIFIEAVNFGNKQSVPCLDMNSKLPGATKT